MFFLEIEQSPELNPGSYFPIIWGIILLVEQIWTWLALFDRTNYIKDRGNEYYHVFLLFIHSYKIIYMKNFCNSCFHKAVYLEMLVW